jgi:hypothetical protein
MKFLRLLTITLVSLFVVGVLLPPAQADEYNKKTIFTFSGPVEIPGFHGPMVLPAGTYVFKLLDSMSDRDIVQIFNKDQTHLYATILAIPDYRLTPTDKTVLTFSERAAGSPEAVKAWFYPGDLYGQEFVYPKSRAVELAKTTNEPVLSMPEETSENITKPVKTAKEAPVVALEKAPVKAERPTGEEVEIAEVVETTPPAGSAAAVGEKPARKLPKTASEMPLAALCGASLIGLGLGFRLLSRRLT